MQQHGPGSIAMGISDAAGSVDTPVEARVERPAPPPAASDDEHVVDLDADGDDDESPWRRRRDEDTRPHGPLPDPDQLERQKRVEVYRKLWEEDSSRSLFVRPTSPPPRPWKPANTWATGRF